MITGCAVNMVFIQACRKFSRDTLLAINGQHRCVIDQRVRYVVSHLQLHRRGCRAGNHQRRHVLAAHSVTSSVSQPRRAGEIPTVISKHGLSNVNTGQLFHGHRDARVTADKTIPRCSRNNCTRLGLFNARSFGDKSAAIQRWISETKLDLAALVETWHDDASSPQLLACAPPGYKYVETARPRKDNMSTSTNHGGVCLLYESSLHVRTVQLPVFSTFEAVTAFVHRAGFNTVVAVVYRPGSCSVTQSFFDDFSDLLERLSTFSAPLMIAGDFNIHVDDVTDVHAGKLTDILFCHSLRQHVTSPTHVHGHTLDLLITRDDHSVAVLPVDPPLLSDNAFVVADCSCPLLSSATSTTFRRMRNWCALDVDAFDVDLQQSELYRTLPADPKTAFSHYD